jgi:two-component system NtrC family sensor kinase
VNDPGKGYTLAVRRRAVPSRQPDGLGAVFDALPVGLYVVDRNLKVVAWNRLREKGPIGRPRRTTLGRHLRTALGAAGFRAVEPVVREVFRTGQAYEEIAETAGGLFHVRRMPVRHGSEVTHVVSWFEDIRERRELEMRLIASDRLAFLGQLVSGVAHEISNPLAGIAGCTEALASIAARGDRKAAREARQFRDLVRAEVVRCERIVRFLLDSSRTSPGDRADLAPTVSLALRLLERHPAFARLRVRARVPAKLPPARIDVDSLKQVIMALAMNASQAMPTGGTLAVRASRSGRRLRLEVADSGSVVPVPRRAHLFEPYATADAQRGAGLGLAIARSLLRSRGGDLVYRPRKDGNVFSVSLRTASGTP